MLFDFFIWKKIINYLSFLKDIISQFYRFLKIKIRDILLIKDDMLMEIVELDKY